MEPQQLHHRRRAAQDHPLQRQEARVGRRQTPQYSGMMN